MMSADVLICSASTFCLWPGIASSQTVYFPSTGYIDSLSPTQLCRHNISENFKWIIDPKIYNNFTKNSTVEEILTTLRKDL